MARFQSLGKKTFSGRRPYILFLCTGNTCRSPMAYGVMKRLCEENGVDDIEIRTAGVMTIPGLLPTAECRQVLEKDGINIDNHRSCQLTEEMAKRATVILGMTSFHVQMALRVCESARGKTYLLKEYTGSDSKNSQIQDPMGCTLEVYKKVYRDIRGACRKLMANRIAEISPSMIRAREEAERKKRVGAQGGSSKSRKKTTRKKNASRASKKKSAAPRKAGASKSSGGKKKPAAKKSTSGKKTSARAASSADNGSSSRKKSSQSSSSAKATAKSTTSKTEKPSSSRKKTSAKSSRKTSRSGAAASGGSAGRSTSMKAKKS